MADNKAAFGVFPQMKPRRSKQDREASANIPVAVARGLISGTLGMPGDIESLARLPYELITGKESKTILPTSEDIEKRLPFKSDTPVSRAATGLGQIGGGFYTGPLSGARAVTAVPGALYRAGKDFVQAAGQPAVNVIKPKGGNWLTGSVEKAVEPLKTKTSGVAGYEQAIQNPKISPAVRQELEEARQSAIKDEAINNWIDRNLTNYIKKEMATPEDPVRLLIERRRAEVEGKYIKDQERAQRMADRAAAETDPRRQANLSRQAQQMRDEADLEREFGLAHLSHLPSGFGENSQLASYIRASRESRGFPREGMAQTPSSKIWEDLSDEAIVGSKPSEISPASRNLNLWIEKLDPNESVYRTSLDIRRELGFDHIVDVLRQDLAAGRINPDQLSKVSMEQAVRRTAEFDQDMAKKMREARIKITEGMPVHKEYPDGYKWIELTKPEAKLPEGYSILPDVGNYRNPGNELYTIFDDKGNAVISGATEKEALGLFKREEREKILEDALKYEGETMGHCVGGYCPDVLAGRSRIYSLRDAKGEPHVTIEVEPAPNIGFRAGEGPKTPEERFDQQTEWLKGVESGRIGGDVTFAAWWRQKHGIPEPENPPQISQIKGKQNRAPKEEYLPFVQDFVRGGKWNPSIGDFQNTGLYRKSQFIDEFTPEQLDISGSGEYLTMKDIQKLREGKPWKPIDTRPELDINIDDLGMKRGGSVSISDNADSQMMDVLDRKMAEGGAAFGIYPRQRATPSSEETKKRAKQAAEIVAELVFPQDAVDVGMMLVPGGKIARKVGAALIAGGASTDADAGVLKMLKKATAKEPSLPLNLPRAPAKTKEEIRPVAQRMAQQMTGEFVRPDPKKSINPAGKSLKQFKMEQDLTHDIRPVEGKKLLPQDVADIEKQLGLLKIGVSGDTTIADKVLHRAGQYELDIPSPQHGGPLYGLGGEGAWASNNPVAATFQKRVQELSQAHKDAPVLGQFLAMGPQGSNFAMHFADANLRAINPSKMSKQQVEQFNELIRKGTAKSGPRPGFPGIEDKESAYLHFAFDPELRKHFNDLMQKPAYTSKLGLPDGRVVLHAITEPELRNTEVLTSGLSQMRLDPSIDPKTLLMSAHPTYSHVIPKVPGSDITRTRYPVPAELEFPDVAEFIKQNYRPQDATRVYQTATPRQMVDPQHIDEMKMYEELMKQYTGKKKGGAISKAAQIDGNEFVLAAQKYGLSDDMNTLNKLVALVNQGATVDKAARMIAETVEMAEGGKVKKPHDGLIKVTKKRKAKA